MPWVRSNYSNPYDNFTECDIYVSDKYVTYRGMVARLESHGLRVERHDDTIVVEGDFRGFISRNVPDDRYENHAFALQDIYLCIAGGIQVNQRGYISRC